MFRKVLQLSLAFMLLSGSARAEELISWHEDINAARKISQQYKVPLLVHFYGDQCLPCKTLEKNVFTRPEVATTIQRYFVPVRVNATRDRQTAAQYGVHSWPTDVFVGPDGKVLTQGVCNQNANSYLQNLQSVAVMNRDRNIMLAGGSPTSPSTSPAASPYGRTASANLQQAAPGRDEAAPSPYDNPSSGAAPYAAQHQTSDLVSHNKSTLPSPTWNGQSAHGQAHTGLLGSGPLPSSANTTVLPAESALSNSHKDANVPPSVEHAPPASTALANTAPMTVAPRANEPKANGVTLSPIQGSTIENPHFASKSNIALPGAQPVVSSVSPQSSPELGQSAPTASLPNALLPSSMPSSAALISAPAAEATETKVIEPATQPSVAQPSVAQPSTPLPSSAGQLVSKPTVDTAVNQSGDKAATGSDQGAAQSQASVPALSGFCPVALFANRQWVEGLPQHAVRHRGRIYLLSSADAVKQFLSAPDTFSPVLSGYDPLVFLSQGRLVEGSVYDGLQDPKYNQILLFSTPENKKFFQDNYDRLASELATILRPNTPRTAATPATSVTR